MKTIALLLAMTSQIHLGSFEPTNAIHGIFRSFEHFVIEACDTPDPGNEDHYE